MRGIHGITGNHSSRECPNKASRKAGHAMRFTSATSSDGVTEQFFTLTTASGEVPGVLWTPDGDAGPRPLILMGHGGGQHKQAPGIVARARRFAADGGFA